MDSTKTGGGDGMLLFQGITMGFKTMLEEAISLSLAGEPLTPAQEYLVRTWLQEQEAKRRRQDIFRNEYMAVWPPKPEE